METRKRTYGSNLREKAKSGRGSERKKAGLTGRGRRRRKGGGKEEEEEENREANRG